MPFCKGCGHSHILRKLNDALVQLHLQPEDVCIVSDIGCIGLADALFAVPHTVHTTHGRSTGFATGIALADSILASKKLKTIVLIGDGGAMIGLLHLVNAALLNVDVTVVLCNNFLFGMTGGQHSSFSPLDFITQTTPSGNIIPPLDMCKITADAHSEFVARKYATDKDLSETLAAAIQHKGFSLVEIIELCTEHATEKNELTGASLENILRAQEQETGLLQRRNLRKDFGTTYTNKFPVRKIETSSSVDDAIIPQSTSTLQTQIGIVIAGSAGERVQSSARKFCEAAMRAGLYCTQKNDNPVTQGSGFSLSEIVISPDEIFYTGIDIPNVVIIVSKDGLKELTAKNYFENLPQSTLILLDEELEKPSTSAQVLTVPFRKQYGGKKSAMKALEFYLTMHPVFPQEVMLL